MGGLFDADEDDKAEEGEDGVKDDVGDEGEAVEQRVVQVARIKVVRVGERRLRGEGQQVEVAQGVPTRGKATLNLEDDLIRFFLSQRLKDC